MDIKSPDTKFSISVVSTVFGCLIAGIIFAFMLVIFKHPLKYSFYIFSLTLAGLLFFIIFRYRDGFDITIMKSVRLVDCVMMIFVSIILFSNFIGSFSSEVTFLAALIVLFFLPGWALVRVLGLDRLLRGNIEFFVLSFSLSLIISALFLLYGLFSRQKLSHLTNLSLLFSFQFPSFLSLHGGGLGRKNQNPTSK